MIIVIVTICIACRPTHISYATSKNDIYRLHIYIYIGSAVKGNIISWIPLYGLSTGLFKVRNT